MDRSLLSLGAAGLSHAALGFGAAACVEAGWNPAPAQVLFDAVFLADSGLLGVWAGLGRHSKAAGFCGVGIGLVYLCTLAAAALRPSPAGRITPGDDVYVVVWVSLLLLGLALATMATILAVSLAMRRRRVELARLAPATTAGGNAAGLQYSILQLMLAVLAIAVLIKLGPFAQAHLNDYNSYVSSLVAVTIGGVSFGGAAMMAAVAPLATRWPGFWSLVAIVLSAAVGLLPAYYFPRFLTADVAAMSATTALEALLVAGSMLVVRASGYRLVRRDPPHATS